MIFPTISINLERWKWNKTFEIYVSTKGRVKNKSKVLVPPMVTKNGYLSIFLPYFHKFILVHRLVMLTWCPRADADLLTVDHINHNKRDNSLQNLEWVTFEENQRRAQADYIDFNSEYEKKRKQDFKGKVNITKNDELLYTVTWNEVNSNSFKNFLSARNINYASAKNVVHDLLCRKITQGVKNKFGMVFSLEKEK